MKMHTKEHQWVMFRNPRNRRIQVSACHDCGSLNAPALATKTCAPVSGKHPMIDRGWVAESSLMILSRDDEAA